MSTKDNISNPKDFGWVKLHRKIRGHWLYTEKRKLSKYEAWLDLVMDANHHIGKVVIGNTVVPVPRGSTLTSIKKLAVRWGWSRHKTDDFLKALKKDTMIEHKKDTHFTLISIVNYDSYQSSENQKGHKKDTKKDINGTSTGHKQEEKERKKYSQNSDEFRLASLLLGEIRKRKPDFKRPNLQQWSVHIDRMIRLDSRKPDRIEAVIRWCQQDAPQGERGFGWQDNILSTSKLREKFDKLELAMQASQKQRQPRVVKFTGAGPSAEFLKSQLDELLKIPEQERTPKDRAEIKRLQVCCEPAKQEGMA